MPAGAPSKYDPKYCDEIVEFCGDGFSIGAFAGHIGVCRDTITEWGKVHPEFSAAVTRAKAASLLAWEKKGHKVADGHGGAGSSTVVVFALKNLGGGDWADKQEHDHTHSGDVTITRRVVKAKGKPEEID